MASLPPPSPPTAGVAVGKQRAQVLPREKEIRTILPDSSRPPLSLPTLNHQQQPRHRIVVDNREWRRGNSIASETEELELDSCLSLDPQEALRRILLILSQACSSLQHLEQQQQPQQQAGSGGDSPVVYWPLSLGALYVPLLRQCVETRSASSARVLHGHIVKTGINDDIFLSTALVNVYAKCGLMDGARKVFDKLSTRNIVSWTALITGHAYNGQPEQALRVFIRLLESWMYPTNYTLGAVLTVCATLYALDLGHQVHAYAVKYGIAANNSVANGLSNLYAKCRDLDSCLKVFRSIPDKDRNVISWTTAISACSDNGRADLGLRTFADMLQQQGEASEGDGPNEFTLTSAMSLCCTSYSLDLGKQIHSLCIRLGCSNSSVPIRNSIMYFYLKCGKVEEARRLINDFIQDDDEEETASSPPSINLITWNAMIAGFAQRMDGLLSTTHGDDVSAHARGIEALNIFSRLNRRSDMRPDLFTYSSVLTVCSGMAALDQGEQIHAQVIKTGYLSDVVLGSALVNMYAKCGMIQKAANAFAEMPTRTLISWTSMIAGYSQHGPPQQAIQLFEDMRLSGVVPNQVTFVALLSACSHGGMVDRAHHYFRLMTDDYGIEPVMDHYACMVDMYVRLGQLEKAFDFINTKMPFEPNEVIWSIVIAGCRSLGKTDLALQASQRLLQLKPRSPEAYSLLLNTYVSAEKWQEVCKIRRLMKHGKIGSRKDVSWITVKERVYSFRPGDRSNTRSPEIYMLLEDLISRAKAAGYASAAPDDASASTSASNTSAEVLVDPEEAEQQPTAKKIQPVHHSEKLAFAFGLLKTPAGAPIRIMKNTGISRDGHGAMKMFSTLTGREIIVRDSKRLHRFLDGNCSCGDHNAFL